MAIHRDMVVDIPEHAYLQRKGGKEYVYVYTQFFRRADGRPSNRSMAVGVLTDSDDWVMHPNDNYLRMRRVPTRRKESSTLSVGFAAAVESAFAEGFGEEACLAMRTCAAYMVREGAVMSYVDDFCEKTHFTDWDGMITSQRASELFLSVTKDQEHDFYRSWVPRAGREGGYVCYDVTSVSTWSSMIQEAEYGYNRDHERLPQVNLGLFYSESTHRPVYLDIYNGSVNDYTQVTQAVANARAAGLEGPIKLVGDGVFFQESKLPALVADGITVTCGMPAYLDLSKGYVDAHMDEVTRPENYVGHDSTFAMLVDDQEIFGVPCRVLVGFCPEAMRLLNADLDAKLARYETEEIPEVKRYKTVIRKRRFTGLFDFEETEDGRYTFSRNEGKIAEARRRFGYFTILTTDREATAREIVDAYREKDEDEKQFMDLKQFLGARRPRVHSQEALEGKYFVLLIALVLTKWLRERLGAYMSAHHLTLRRCLMKLSDVRMYVADDEVRLEKAITKEQRELLALCGVDADGLEERERASIIASRASRGDSGA